MKHRMTISVEEETILQLRESLRKHKPSGKFRNKSHFIEISIKKLLEDQDGR